jgi:hypothetical protein
MTFAKGGRLIDIKTRIPLGLWALLLFPKRPGMFSLLQQAFELTVIGVGYVWHCLTGRTPPLSYFVAAPSRTSFKVDQPELHV